MDLKQAYNILKTRLEKDSKTYNIICKDSQSTFLSVFNLVKHYKSYILYCTDNNKNPRISKINSLNNKQEILLGNLLEASVIFTESLSLNVENILKVSDKLEDPYDVIDIMLNDYITTSLSDDDVYENIILSLFNIIIESNFENVLKSLFLKYSYIKN